MKRKRDEDDEDIKEGPGLGGHYIFSAPTLPVDPHPNQPQGITPQSPSMRDKSPAFFYLA